MSETPASPVAALVQQARQHIDAGELDDAIAVYRRVLAILQQSTDADAGASSVAALARIAELLTTAGRVADAASVRAQASDGLLRQLALERRIAALPLLSQLAQPAMGASTDESLTLFASAASTIAKAGDDRALFIALTDGSWFALRAGRHDESERSALDASAVLGRLSAADRRFVLAPRGRLAEIFLQLRRLEDAVPMFDDLLADTTPVTDAGLAAVRFDALVGKAAASARGKDDEATRALFEAAFTFAREVFGSNSTRSAAAANEWAGWLQYRRRYRDALPLVAEEARIRRALGGELDLQYAAAMNLAGVCLDQIGRYRAAEDHYQRALSIYRTQLGPGDPHSVLVLTNLAELARVLDDFGVAEERFLEARAIEQDAGRGRGQQMGFIQNNLGEVYLATGRHHEAAVCLLKAAAIRRARFGRDSSQHLRTVSSLVTLAGERRQFGRARRLIRLTLPRLESIGEGFNRASFEFRLAALDVNEDPAPEPLARLRAAVESIVATDGDETMTSADALLQVAFAHVGGGDWDNARAYAARATHAADMALLEFLTAGSREQVAKWADHVRRGQDLFVSLVAGRLATAPADLENAYSCVLRRKALETRALLLGKPGLDGTGFNPDRYRTIVDDMVALRRTLVRLQIEGDAASGPGHAESDMRAVRRQLAEREMQLAQTIPDKSLEWEILETSHEVVAASLPPETVAVEYVRYRDVARSEPASGEPSPSRYAAFVVRSAGVELIHDSRVHFSGFNPFAAFTRPGDVKPPVVYDLGDAGEIDAEIRRFRDALIEGSTSSTRIPQWIRRGRFLYNRLVKPLAHELGGVKHVYLAPDGALNVLPFELLATGEASADGAERLLVDALSEADVSYMLYGRELAGFLGHVAIKKNALVIAAPNFDFDGSGAPAANGGVFVELPGTRAEGAAVAARIESIAVTGDEAVEARLLQSAAADIIHIATHGIYLEPPPQAPAAAPSTLEFDDRLKRRARLADPMERSGLVFAGANAVLAGLAVPPAAGDGIVFASEIVDLDLRATDLVVLSACQTAIGDVRTGDGVQGLRRAFAGAGCRSLVCALWRIPDQISASWMETFYDALMQQQSKSAALATARARLRAQYPGQPAYWGGFILTGDPKPLRRFDPLSDLTVASISMKGLFDRNGDAPRSRTPAEEIEARYNAGREKLRQGDVDAAIQLFTEALGIADGPEASRALAFYQRAGAYRRQRQFEAALQDYATMLAMPLPDRLAMSARFDRGTTLSLSGDYAGAIGEYSTVLATSGLEPGDRVQALVNRGSAYAMAGDDASAIQDFSAVIDTAGSDRVQRFKALVNRASLFLQMARYADAIADADVALSLGLGEAAGIERAQNLRARAAQLLKSSGETV